MDVKNPSYINENLDAEMFPDLKACLDIWNDKRGDRFAPSWDELGFLAFPTEMIARTVLVDVIPDPLDFRFRFFGTVFCDLEGYDLTGKSVDDYQPSDGAKITRERFEAFYNDPKPTLYKMQNGINAEAGGALTIYIGLRLPLSDDGKTMNRFFGIAQLGCEQDDIKKYYDELVSQSSGPNTVIKRSTSKF